MNTQDLRMSGHDPDKSTSLLDRVTAVAGQSAPKAPFVPMKADPLAEILAARGATHGSFADNAKLSQHLKDVIRGFITEAGGQPWNSLTDLNKEVIDMLCLKVSRIVTGDADVREHFDDIGGYARLAAERCTK